MNTYTDSWSVNPTLPRATAILLSLAAAVLGAGCGGPIESEALSVQEAAMTKQERDCPSGTCSDPNNASGIYIAEGFNYCIPAAIRGSTFCPQGFTRDGDKAFVTGQRIVNPGVWPNPPDVRSFRLEGTWKNQVVEVNGVVADTSTGEAVAYVNLNGLPEVLTGDDLLNLVLHVRSDEFVFNLRFNSRAVEKSVWVYEVQYQVPVVSASWTPYCQDGAGKAAFLPGRSVHSITAEVTADGNTTMACVSGAIGGCMAWGYRPWEAPASGQDQANYLYGSCLQAKRAAYFVQSGDYNSYTVNGTPLSVQDMEGIMKANSPLPGVEALWSPQGAVCFSPLYRRTPALGGQPLPSLPVAIPVPPCTAEIHEAARNGALGGVLIPAAPLATGPAS